jgi:hypothetical protein
MIDAGWVGWENRRAIASAKGRLMRIDRETGRERGTSGNGGYAGEFRMSFDLRSDQLRRLWVPYGFAHGGLLGMVEWTSVPPGMYRQRTLAVSWLALAVAGLALPAGRLAWRWWGWRLSRRRPAFPVLPARRTKGDAIRC